MSIFLTVLLSSAEGERSFSCLKCIESDLLTTMRQTRLSSLSIINEHYEIARKLTLSNLIEIFASKKERKLEFLKSFVKFYDSWFIFFMFTSFYINSRIPSLKLIKPFKI